MKRLTVGAALISLALCGCMSDKQWSDTRLMHQAYMQQTRAFNSLLVEGSNMTFSVNGASKIQMSAPLNPLTTIPQFPEIARDVLSGVETVAGYAALGYIGGKAVDGLVAPAAASTAATAP